MGKIAFGKHEQWWSNCKEDCDMSCGQIYIKTKAFPRGRESLSNHLASIITPPCLSRTVYVIFKERYACVSNKKKSPCRVKAQKQKLMSFAFSKTTRPAFQGVLTKHVWANVKVKVSRVFHSPSDCLRCMWKTIQSEFYQGHFIIFQWTNVILLSQPIFTNHLGLYKEPRVRDPSPMMDRSLIDAVCSWTHQQHNNIYNID